jgi:hypothetical protein
MNSMLTNKTLMIIKLIKSASTGSGGWAVLTSRGSAPRFGGGESIQARVAGIVNTTPQSPRAPDPQAPNPRARVEYLSNQPTNLGVNCVDQPPLSAE